MYDVFPLLPFEALEPCELAEFPPLPPAAENNLIFPPMLDDITSFGI